MRKLNLLIIDENQEDVKEINQTLIDYFPQIESYEILNPIDLSNFLSTKTIPDIVLIDVDANSDVIKNFIKNSGLRKNQIIFLANIDAFVPRAIKTSYEIIIKPIILKRFIITLNQSIGLIFYNEFKYITSENNDSKTIYPTTTRYRKANNLIKINSSNEVVFIKKSDIIYCLAKGKYTVFHLTNSLVWTSNIALGKYEKLLKEINFVRIHHSHLINTNFLSKISKHESYKVELVDGTCLSVSRRRRDNIKQFLTPN